MIDQKVLDMVDKIAEDSLGMTQAKRRTKFTKSDHAGEGAGLGSVLGAVSGALSKKHKAAGTAAGAVIGALAGRALGKRTVSRRKEIGSEGTVKRQEKKKDGTADLPRLTDSKVLRFLENSKK